MMEYHHRELKNLKKMVYNVLTEKINQEDLIEKINNKNIEVINAEVQLK